MSTDRQAMRDRFNGQCYDSDGGKLCLFEDSIDFAESEMRAALAPREVSPELARTEAQLRECCADEDTLSVAVGIADGRRLIAELDRLRVELSSAKAAQPAPAQDGDRATVTGYTSSQRALDAVPEEVLVYGRGSTWLDGIRQTATARESLFRITVTAERFEPGKETP